MFPMNPHRQRSPATLCCGASSHISQNRERPLLYKLYQGDEVFFMKNSFAAVHGGCLPQSLPQFTKTAPQKMRRDYANLRKSPQPSVNLYERRSPPRNRWAFFFTPVAFQNGMWRVLFCFPTPSNLPEKIFLKKWFNFSSFFCCCGV